MIPIRIGTLIFVVAGFLLATATPANAGFKLPVKVRIDLKHPLNPVQVTVGATTVAPSVVGPPRVTVDGNGTIAKTINKTSDVLHKPEDIIVQIAAAPVNLVHNIITLPSRVRDNITNIIHDAFEWYARIIEYLKANIPYFVALAAIGVFALITLAVIFGTLISALIFRLLGSKSRA
jgi:hypothetical protein